MQDQGPVLFGIKFLWRTADNSPYVRSRVRIIARSDRGARESSRTPGDARGAGGADSAQGAGRRRRLLRIP